ncbi:alpha-1,2-mannosyltransferase ktr1 [Coemansia sp. RSA 1797]|nr:alpha-1,2-mannosyltransferase ktr1 [Coemansia sp. RSA 2440]KAJ2594196.1 alpha-1,2-mannosyltransferase ktr1 [Coemansia sp. RSA 1797]
MHKHAHQPRLTRVVLVLVALAAAVLYLACPPPIEKVRALGYAPDQIRESRLKTANASATHTVRATFVILARNSELHALRTTVRQLEDQFNARHNYPYVFLNNEPFTDEFKHAMEWATSGDCHFGLVPYEHWSVPSWVDNVRAKWAAATMDEHVPYGGSSSYRKMCRFQSGFFFRHKLLDPFDYYWRVEPGVEFTCAIHGDPFRFMVENHKSYAFTITLREFPATVHSLWATTSAFRALYPDYVVPNNTLRWLTADNGKYNMCHFWSNFEIASLAFLRSKQYMAYFDFLDHAGGFFYERWGDAPVHSLAVAMFLNKSQVHYFDNIGYYHRPFQNCPTDPGFNSQYCFCNANRSMLHHPDSCTRAWLDL